MIKEFSAEAYRRIRFPQLLLLLFFSLALDGVLFFVWQKGAQVEAIFYWNIGFAFLWFVNLLFIKCTGIYQYFHIKKLKKKSRIIIDEHGVKHYLIIEKLSRWQVEMIKETKLPKWSKDEYITTESYCVQYVTNLRRKRNGKIVVEGVIEKEMTNEGWEEYSAEFGDTVRRTIHRHSILPYYEGMDEVLYALERLS